MSLIAAAPGTPENPQGTTTPYPPTPWRYSYLVPSDSLFVRQLLPPASILQSGGVPIFPVVNNPTGYGINAQYEVAYGTDSFGNPAEIILTNLSQAQGIYTVNQPNPQFWDSLFQQAFVASLAAYLVPALSLDKSLMQMQIAIAERLIAQARAMDANEGVITQEREASWIAARGGYPTPFGHNAFSEYSMIWPM